MFFYLINNYLICYKTEERFSEGNNIAATVFNFDLYLSLFDEESKPFMMEFSKTQGFCNFIEKSYKEDNDLSFFKQAIKLCSQDKGELLASQMKMIEDQLLHSYRNVI
jgi:hypothetical protein